MNAFLSGLRDYWIFTIGSLKMARRGWNFVLARDLVTQNRIIHDFFVEMVGYWGLKVTVEGLENIDTNRQYMIVGNHQSQMDIPVIFYSLPIPFRIAAKDKLFRIPVFGWFLHKGKFIPIYRGNSAAAIRALELTREILKQGVSMCIFPEGTRSADGKLLPFKKGAFVLAIEHQLDILPVVITGTHEVMRKGSIHIDPSHQVRVRVLPPVSVAGKSYEDRDQINEQVWKQMQACLETR